MRLETCSFFAGYISVFVLVKDVFWNIRNTFGMTFKNDAFLINCLGVLSNSFVVKPAQFCKDLLLINCLVSWIASSEQGP